MDVLVRASIAFRQLLRRGFALGVAMAIGALVVVDAETPIESPWFASAAIFCGGVLAWRCWARWRAERGDVSSDVEIGALLSVMVYGTLVRADGSLSSPLYSLVYVLVAVVSAFARPLAAVLVLTLLVLLEGAIRYEALGERTLGPLSIHATFIVTFALLNLV